MPTRILRSETGCQTFFGRAEVATPPDPRIFSPGRWVTAAAGHAAAAKVPSQTLSRNVRRERCVS